jgi:hypothetical protein
MTKEQGGPRGFQMSEEPAPGELPEMSFATLVLSLSASAAMHLGMEPAPGEQAPEIDLPLAKQTIDILEVLRGKTRGNLDEAESELLEKVLHDLRMKYVERGKAGE